MLNLSLILVSALNVSVTIVSIDQQVLLTALMYSLFLPTNAGDAGTSLNASSVIA